jgi:hypothetical protein
MTVRIGGGQGFYGDGLDPVGDVLADGVDYLVCEALAELTLAILQKDRQRDESQGFTKDLPAYLNAALPAIVDGRTKFITNAGGINPVAAGRAAVETLRKAGVSGLKVATIVGDDVRAHSDELGLPDDALFANAYLGARPIVEALEAGALIVITGRVADASLFVAPAAFEYGWGWDDWDRLAAGVVVGHLLECSGQVTGGNYTGAWWENPNPQRIAFPIAEVEEDGSAVITKPKASGGMVTFDTVREQLLYEVHDPSKYLNPDVSADFTSLTLTDLGGDRVRVTGTRGNPPPATYKGLVCTSAGWAGDARFTYTWPDAEAKARASVRWVRERAEAAGIPVLEWHEEYFGAGAYAGSLARPTDGNEPAEVIGRVAWRTDDPESASRPGRGIGVLGLGGPPGTTGFGFGRPPTRPTQLLAVDAFHVDRKLVDPGVRVQVEEI